MQTTIKKTNNPAVNNAIEEMAYQRHDAILDSIDGAKRLRSYRWEGKTSLRDTMRMSAFISSICDDGVVNRATYNRLSKEIPTFHTILGQHLSRNLTKLMA